MLLNLQFFKVAILLVSRERSLNLLLTKKYLDIATKEILIFPTADHQQELEIVSLSETKESRQTALSSNFLVGIWSQKLKLNIRILN